MTNNTMTRRWLQCLLMAVATAGCAAVADPAKDRVKAGKALFDEKCRTVAGQRIYRTVEGVEGIVLLKVRPRTTESNLSDPMWPGAAFARESEGDGYITTFLGYEHSGSQDGKPVTPTRRGYITPDFQPGDPNLPGYRYVDVVDQRDSGKRWRYSGYYDRPWEREPERYSSKNPYSFWKLDRKPAPADSPRYGVTFEDHVDYAERQLGLASSTVKVIDLKTQEVLGEMTRYAWTPATPGPGNPTPWLTAYNCGTHFTRTGAETRQFVDQILQPLKSN